MTSSGTWKSFERRIARKFGAERNSKRGIGEDVADVETDKFSIECKLRANLPKWLKDAMRQSESNCTEGKTPIVVLKEKYKPDNKSLVLMELADFYLMRKRITNSGKLERQGI